MQLIVHIIMHQHVVNVLKEFNKYFEYNNPFILKLSYLELQVQFNTKGVWQDDEAN